MRSRILLPAIILAVLSASFAACSSSEKPSTPAQQESVAVETATARATGVSRVSRYSGTIRGTQRVPLSTKMMGTVTDLDVEEGDRVSKGEVLVRVRSQNVEAQKRQIEARLREAQAALDNARTNFERMKALHAKESATQKEFDDAKTAYERAQARVDALEGQLDEIEDTLDYATVRAPINGYVVEKHSEEGAIAAPGQPLLVVETLDDLKAVVQVSASDINRFAVGDSVTVEVGAAGNVRRTGVVSQVNPSGHSASRQFTVQVRIERADTPSIKSGMYAQVLRPGAEMTVITVPREAIVRSGQLDGLYAVKNGTALLRWVRLGKAYGDRVEVLSGLSEGETYVVDGRQRLVDGQTVQPRHGS